ncbi:MAG: Gfo/Idh/MocA family oxidoreductase [Verrucomicrobiaceae bacterium]|nr:MAG: Gfo/Idh/MocA family oxidoreductase [Verrucomicrobiaceae bacterium]
MNSPASPFSRRQFLSTTTKITAASAFAGLTVPHVFAAPDNTVGVALVGCGGRGTGAADQALSVVSLPTKMVAMADVFEYKMNESHKALSDQYKDKPERFDVPEDRRFLGMDAYKKAMDVLKPGDIVILTTPLAFRAPHFKYAIERGLHVFMEKPVTADGPSSKKMLALAEEADKKNLKVGVGLMVRHCRARQELWKRIRDGQIGDIIAMRSYRMHGPVASCFSVPKPEGKTEVNYQIERFHSFLWASGGLFSDFYIHFIDECCWMKDKWPVKAQAVGGRHYRGEYIDQNFDSYAVEYTFDDGTKFFFDGRTMLNCKNEEASYAHGSKGSAIISTSGHTPGRCRIFKDQIMKRGTEVWGFPQPEQNPYQLEWDDLAAAIINNTPYNEVPRGVQASLVTSMGRMAAHTGREVSYDQMLNCAHEFAPNVESLTQDGPAPVMPGPDGKYPVPAPGIKVATEY